MGRIDHNTVYLCVHQRIYAIHNIGRHAHSGSAEQTSLRILCRVRILNLFFNVLDGDEPCQIPFLINDRQLFLSGPGKNLFCLLQVDSLLCCDQPVAGHALLDLFGIIGLKFQIPVRNNAHKLLSTLFRNGYTGDTEFTHQFIRIL